MLITVPTLNYAVITVGDFVISKRRCCRGAIGDSSAVRSVALVQEVQSSAVKVTWWLTLDKLRNEGYLETPPPPAMNDYSNLLKCRSKEVCELRSEMAAINTNGIVDIAFIFHADTLEKEFINCAGMNRVYFTCYQYQPDGRLSYINRHAHSPFSLTTIESFPSRMWHFILDVKHNVEKMFNDTKQYHSCKKMVQMKCSLESWHFFCFLMTNSGAVVVNYHQCYTERNLYCDLSLGSSSYHKYLQLIHLDTEATMNWARNLFGLTFGIGSRNRAPKKGDDPVTLHFGDIVNLALVRDRFVLRDRFRDFVGSQGIDFIFDKNARTLKIRARYSPCLAQSNDVAITLRQAHDNLLPPRERIPNNLVNNVVAGTFFMREGLLLEVIAVDGNNVIVEEAEENSNQYTLDIYEAAQLINDYIT
jgi:hypothetical protein